MRSRFPFRFDRRWAPLFCLLGVQESDGVELAEDGSLLATYGRFEVKTPLENIDHTVVTGPHQWFKAVGLRLSLTDDGLSFGFGHGQTPRARRSSPRGRGG